MDVKNNLNTNKRVSTFIKNSDHNAYLAYKQIMKTEGCKSERSRELGNNNGNCMRYPFHLTAQRFRWQNTKNRGETIELQGNLSKYHFKDSTVGRWENLMNKSAENKKPSKSIDRRIIENAESTRTLTPSSSYIPYEEITTRVKTDLSPSCKSKATGSIYNLFQAIPEPTFAFKKHHEKKNISSVFTPEFNELIQPVKLRKGFDPNSFTKSEYAGYKTDISDNSYSGLNIKKKMKNYEQNNQNERKTGKKCLGDLTREKTLSSILPTEDYVQEKYSTKYSSRMITKTATNNKDNRPNNKEQGLF